MQVDLNQHETRKEPFRVPVCIIGAGIAGLTLAHRLAQQGIEVALLEAGGLQLRGSESSSAAISEGTPHAGTEANRVRAFGGASLRWGGQLLPLPENPGPSWPVTAKDLLPYYRNAEQLLAVDAMPYEAAPFFAAAGVSPPGLLSQFPFTDAGLSKWTPFSHRNMAATLGAGLLACRRVTVFFNAPVNELLTNREGTAIEAVSVCTLRGGNFRFEAQQVVVAAGTIETVRLLLASRSTFPRGLGNEHDQLGRNFHDHLTLRAATMAGAARKKIVEQLGPWIFGSTLHAIKLEASEKLREDLNLNPVLAHFTLEDPAGSGLAVLREMLLSRQSGSLFKSFIANTPKLAGASLEAAKLAWSAKMRHRRFIADDTVVALQINAAQDAPSASRITLSGKLDPCGMPLPVVDWRVSSNELRTLRQFAQHLRSRFEEAGVADGMNWNADLFTEGLLESEPAFSGIDDARHSMGGACMANEPTNGVVDANLTVHGVRNLHLASCAVFPNGSPQLPTLPLMALTLRLADRLKAKLASRPQP